MITAVAVLLRTDLLETSKFLVKIDSLYCCVNFFKICIVHCCCGISVLFGVQMDTVKYKILHIRNFV